MIFPGMDPYLEHPQFWMSVHTSFIVYLLEQLQPQLVPQYVAAIEERVYVEGADRHVIPDVHIERRAKQGKQPTEGGTAVLDEPVIVTMPEIEAHERYIEILDPGANMRVMTVIEIVSPSNKRPGPGRESYLTKQREVRASPAHLVEIDLHRRGEHVLSVGEWLAREQGEYDYLMCVNRANGTREDYELYLRTLRDPLSTIRIPLSKGDSDVRLDVQSALARTWANGAYQYRIDYQKPCVPALRPEDQAWANELIRQASLPIRAEPP